MSTLAAYRYEGDGTFTALRRFQADCDRQFTIGEVYRMEPHAERSAISHRHLFAQIADAWSNLPADYDGRFSTPEALRKFLLIKAGYADHRQHVCHTKGEATRLRAALAPMDSYALVTLTGCVVDVYTAQSMSSRAMDKRRFQAAKDAMLGLLDDMLGVGKGDTERHAAEAA